jgi:hypothetical protein
MPVPQQALNLSLKTFFLASQSEKDDYYDTCIYKACNDQSASMRQNIRPMQYPSSTDKNYWIIWSHAMGEIEKAK